MAAPLFNIGGLASGLDTNSIVAGLMNIERAPVRALQSKQTSFQAKADAWKNVSTRLSALRTRLNDITLPGKFEGFVEATSSDATIARVGAGIGMAPLNLTFTVDRLAKAEQRASITNFTSTDQTVGAGSFTFALGTLPTQTITTTSSTTLADLAQQINALNKGVTANVVSIDGTSHKLVLQGQSTGAANTITIGGNLTGLMTANFTASQAAQDAQITMGSGGGALVVTRPTNTINDLSTGLSLTLLKESATPVTLTGGRSADKAATSLKAFVDELNATARTLKDLAKIDTADPTKNGPLAGDSTLRSLRFSVSGFVSSQVEGLTGPNAYASSVGLSIQRDGTFSLDETKLKAALASDWTGVARLFQRAGQAADSRLQFVNATDTTAVGSYGVSITQAATAATVTGSLYSPPVSNTSFSVQSSGKTINLTIDAGATIAQAISSINSGLDAQGVNSLRASNTGGGAIKLLETRHGVAGNFTVSGAAAFGLDGTYTGLDVVGTINGQAATGVGRSLTSSAGTSLGLMIQVSATAAEVTAAGGTLNLGSMAFSQGWGGMVGKFIAGTEGTSGFVELAKNNWDARVKDAKEQAVAIERRLVLREKFLRSQFSAMEQAISTMRSQSTSLSGTPVTGR